MDLIRMPGTEGIPFPRGETTISTTARAGRTATSINATTTTTSTTTTTPACSPSPGSYVRQSSGYMVSPVNYNPDVDTNGSVRSDITVDTSMPPKKLTSDDIPVLDSFPGHYGFDLYRPLCGDAYEATETKPSTAFFYFKDENGWTNLYSKKTPTWWTLSYWCQRQPPDGAFIRLTPVYGTSDKQQEVIQRCFEDFMALPSPTLARYSIVVVGNSSADYFFDPTTERLCVTIPYERPKEGCEYSQFNGKFMCFNSCLYNGGQGNKKPLFLIITLERLVAGTDPSKGQCEVLGRQCIKFRSCACPKRDKENSERRITGTDTQSLCSYGKRTKENERGEKMTKKSRLVQMDYTGASDKLYMRFTQGKWGGSPCHDRTSAARHSGSLDEGGMDPTNGDVYGEMDGPGGATIMYNGEPYNLLLVPTGLPGGMETLCGVRYGLMRTWLYASQMLSRNSMAEDQDVLKQELLDGDKSDLLKHDELYGHQIHSRSITDNAVQQLLTIEAQVAQALRERILLSSRAQGAYGTYGGGESTDSQPNSNGAVGLGVETDTNHVNELSQSCAMGALSTDSGISTDPLQQQQQQQSRNVASSFSNSAQLSTNMFPIHSTGPRGSIYNGPTSSTQLGTYDIDYGSRFHPSGASQAYITHSGNTDLPTTHGVVTYPPELMETYALVQQASTTNNHPSESMSSLDHTASSAKTQPRADSRSDLTATGAAMALSVNLNHALNSSAFYPTTHYFGNRPSNSDHVSSILDSFPRSQLGANSAQTNLCFYPPGVGGGTTTLSESLLLPEDVLTSYLEREKAYNDESTSCTRHPSSD